jgi:hypothetical protein
MQYADHTFLFIKINSLIVERVKWALKIFENISGLKINFDKSELISFNMNIHTDAYYASLLNCSLGKLSIKYLEMILHWKKPSKYDWQLIIDKIQLKAL